MSQSGAPWDWQVFCQSTVESTRFRGCFAPSGDTSYLDWLMSAWGTTLALAGLAWILALAVGTAVGVARTLPSKPLNALANVWGEVFRNIPLLAQLFIWYHVIPELFEPMRQVSPFALAVVGLGFFTSARVAEQVRAGIQSLPKGQREAGLAMGFTLAQTYRYVLLPRAFRVVLPPLTSEAMSIVKNSSVAYAIGVGELIFFLLQAQEDTARHREMYLAVTVLFFVSSFIVNRVAIWLERRVAVPGLGGAGR